MIARGGNKQTYFIILTKRTEEKIKCNNTMIATDPLNCDSNMAVAMHVFINLGSKEPIK